ncbi:tetrathionate reductase family octaheme c-type cytochrome [Candidatus Riflebacteria bacterium]
MRTIINQLLLLFLLTGAFLIMPTVLYFKLADRSSEFPWRYVRRYKIHTDHAGYFTTPFKTGSDVTRACLKCHKKAAKDLMHTSHWTWLNCDDVTPSEAKGHKKIGKRNLINNYNISVENNWAACTTCHVGYGWLDKKFDFTDQNRVDCLVCHALKGTYAKGEGGLPARGVDLLAAAKSVAWPKNDNCLICHNYSGGAAGACHGGSHSSVHKSDLALDVHIGGNHFYCIDCHQTKKHHIMGKSMSLNTLDRHSFDCTSCHAPSPHRDNRLNSHTRAVSCQACHIPEVAVGREAQVYWDWSKAGQEKKNADPRLFQEKMGEFRFKKNLKPEYYWFDGSCDRYLEGDKIDPTKVTVLNQPGGKLLNPDARIWPFKVHRGKQVYDKENKYFLKPVFIGEEGFWEDYDWEVALETAANRGGLPFSGEYDFAETVMFRPLSHLVVTKQRALACRDCHGAGGRMNWETLGYREDPILVGDRRNTLNLKESEGTGNGG